MWGGAQKRQGAGEGERPVVATKVLTRLKKYRERYTTRKVVCQNVK